MTVKVVMVTMVALEVSIVAMVEMFTRIYNDIALRLRSIRSHWLRWSKWHKMLTFPLIKYLSKSKVTL